MKDSFRPAAVRPTRMSTLHPRARVGVSDPDRQATSPTQTFAPSLCAPAPTQGHFVLLARWRERERERGAYVM